MGLTDPLSESDPEAWTVRFAAHAFLGLLAWHALIWTIPAAQAAWAVPAAYFLGWKVAVQRVGSGLWDALLDALAFGFGAILGLELLAPSPVFFAAILGAMAAVIAHGVWRRQ